MPPTVKKTFRISVKLKDENAPILAEGLEPGVLFHQDIIFDLPEAVYGSPLFIRTLLDARRKVLEEHVTTIAEEIE